MDVLKMAQDLLPVGAVLGILGITFVVNNFFRDPVTGKAPRWLLFVPLTLGIIGGFVEYYTTVDLATYSTLPMWRHIWLAIKLSIAYAGSGVFLWEFGGRFIWKKYLDQKGNPTP